MIEKFDFMLGNWHLDYQIPKSKFSEAATGTGTGVFKKALDDRYITFDYSSSINGKTGQAHAIFAWDEKAKLYRFWWFESSGNFLTATCDFVNDDTLFLNWHDSLLIQTFKKTGPNAMELKMETPN